MSSHAAESATPWSTPSATLPALYTREAGRVFRSLLTFCLILAAALVVWLILLFFGAHFTVQPAAGPGA